MFQASHKLPVYRHRHHILRLLKRQQVIVIESPTGSGKTTQLPIILHKAHYTEKGLIGITQPRRIAATSVARYIRQHITVKAQHYVAHKMRFEDATTPETRIKIMTDGTLLQEIKHDPLLSAYSAIIIDEAHERSLTIDFILGLLKRLLPLRPDLKVIISSATINAQAFSNYFSQCPVVHIPAKAFPVERVFRNCSVEKPEDLVEEVIGNIETCLKKKKKGDILVFLPGEHPIKACTSILRKKRYARTIQIMPLYSRLSSEEQELVFLPAKKHKTKVILATNIAETSVTIDGVVYVVDSGLAKINHYDGARRTSALLTTGISQASADQRMGRAGRTQPGYCVHLFSEKEHRARPRFTLEEIRRTDLSEVVLRMADLGIKNFESFDFISSPEKSDLVSAVRHLQKIKALEGDKVVTSLGELMLKFPLVPCHAKIVVTAMIDQLDALHSVLIVTSFLSSQQPFLLPIGQEREARNAHAQFADTLGDFARWIKLFHRFTEAKDPQTFCQKYFLDVDIMHEIANVYLQLKDICEELHVTVKPVKASYYKLMFCVIQGLVDRVCTMGKRNTYQSASARGILIHPGSTLYGKKPSHIVSGEIVKTTRTYARSVGVVRKEWLAEIDRGLLAQLDRDKRQSESRKSPELETKKTSSRRRRSRYSRKGKESSQ